MKKIMIIALVLSLGACSKIKIDISTKGDLLEYQETKEEYVNNKDEPTNMNKKFKVDKYNDVHKKYQEVNVEVTYFKLATLEDIELYNKTHSNAKLTTKDDYKIYKFSYLVDLTNFDTSEMGIIGKLPIEIRDLNDTVIPTTIYDLVNADGLIENSSASITVLIQVPDDLKFNIVFNSNNKKHYFKGVSE